MTVQLAQRGSPGLVQELLLELEQLPPARAAALRVVQVVDDTRSGAADVAKAASVDPALTTRMLRMANSAYYGLSGRVASAAFAVTVIGFSTVRSLAVLSAAGFVGDDDLPPGFWARGAATAAGTSMLARRVGAEIPSAFCVGILHDLGTALLWRHAISVHAPLLEQAAAGEDLLALEQAQYGATHASLCADVLASWAFPDDLCVAIGRHHDSPSAQATPLRRALQGGIVLAGLVDGSISPDDPYASACLEAASVSKSERDALVEQVAREGAELTGALLG